MGLDRSNPAIWTSVLRLVFYVAFIGATIYFGRKPGLRGRLTPVLLALIDSLIFSGSYELCARVQDCAVPLDLFRVWSGVVSIHFVLAWGIFLVGLSRYVADLLNALKHAGDRPAPSVALFGHYADRASHPAAPDPQARPHVSD